MPKRAEKHTFNGENLAVGYEDKLIINDLNITIPEGKFSVIIGPNGCGKSTLLKSFARLLKPSKGNILLDGKSIYDIPTLILAKQIGLLPQSPLRCRHSAAEYATSGTPSERCL